MIKETPRFKLSFEFEEEYDALADADLDDDDEDYDERPAASNLHAAAAAEQAVEAVPDMRTPHERTADLLKSMASQRKVLLGILSFCTEPRAVSEVDAFVEELQTNNRSVYTSSVICSHLERAGALELISEDGRPFVEVEAEPRVVVVDGIEFLEPGEPPQPFWSTTSVGIDAVAADKPADRVRALFEKDEAYLFVYKFLLEMCSAEGGVAACDFHDAIDDNPLVRNSKRASHYFVEKLEKCDALEWAGSWRTTEIGSLALGMLRDVEPLAAVDLGSLPGETGIE